MRKIKEQGTICVWFSCGVASAVAAKKTIELYSNTHHIEIVNNPVDEEDEDNIRFMKDVQDWIDFPILTQMNSDIRHTSAVKVWSDRKYMSGIKGAPCTMLLKKAARYEFERNNEIEWHVLGFTADEKQRHERFVNTERKNLLPVLINLELTKQDCFNIIRKAGIKIPRVYEMGYPNANCIGCVKSSSPTYWNLVRKNHPQVFEERAKQSREIGCRLVRVKGKRLFLDELNSEITGGKIKSYECGIFCDTN